MGMGDARKKRNKIRISIFPPATINFTNMSLKSIMRPSTSKLIYSASKLASTTTTRRKFHSNSSSSTPSSNNRNESSSSSPPLYEGHIPLSPIQKAFMTLGSALVSFQNPARGGKFISQSIPRSSTGSSNSFPICQT